ncbi:MAG: DUF58 domain-containing protein [Candidatus Sumerlaeota bacterium]|nr:DUF58 domain-containing protein [Candidatus Sumerlaeota bacterium]
MVVFTGAYRAARWARRLARWWAMRWRQRTRHMLTLEGLLFIVVMAAIGLAAVNTGVNLLYLLFAMMAAMLIVSALASWLTLFRISVRRGAPATAVAGEEAGVLLYASNGKRFFQSYSLRFIDQDSEGRAAGICYAMRLPARTTLRLEYFIVFRRRGLRRLERLSVSTRFPFSFVERTASMPAPHEILVFPRLFPAREFLERQAADLGHRESGRKGHGSSLYALRPYMPDDPARMIHWRLSAKTSDLIVREMETDERRSVSLILDNAVEPARAQELAGPFEAAVSCLASVARELVEDGFRVEALTRSGNIPGDTGPAHLARILRAMATIEWLERNGRTPPLARPEEDSLALWFDYGAAPPPHAGPRDTLRVVHVQEWPSFREAAEAVE